MRVLSDFSKVFFLIYVFTLFSCEHQNKILPIGHFRIDLPVVGLKTLIQCKLAGLKGIVLKSKQNVLLDKSKCINLANRNKMFITVI